MRRLVGGSFSVHNADWSISFSIERATEKRQGDVTKHFIREISKTSSIGVERSARFDGTHARTRSEEENSTSRGFQTSVVEDAAVVVVIGEGEETAADGSIEKIISSPHVDVTRAVPRPRD